MTMPAGTYYVGDLCYVLHDEWDECCGLFFVKCDVCREGEFTLKDGRKFASFSTTYGDGTYEDVIGRSYDVDSGSIGCILLSNVDLTNRHNFTDCGQIIEFDQDFEVSSRHGVLQFGHVLIDTDWYNDDDDDNYDDDYYGPMDDRL